MKGERTCLGMVAHYSATLSDNSRSGRSTYQIEQLQNMAGTACIAEYGVGAIAVLLCCIKFVMYLVFSSNISCPFATKTMHAMPIRRFSGSSPQKRSSVTPLLTGQVLSPSKIACSLDPVFDLDVCF